MAFATIDDLEDRLRTTIDAADEPAAQALLDNATALIQMTARQTIDAVAGDTVTLEGNGQSTLVLPQTPVTDVTSVTVDGAALAADDYQWTAHGILRRAGSGFWGTFYGSWTAPQQVVVVYDHGYASTPADLQAVCVEVAARAWSTPIGSVQQESIGSFSRTYVVNETAGLALAEHERQLIVGKYSQLVAT